MAKTERILMKQKVNVTQNLIDYWKRNMGTYLRNLIHAPFLYMEDYGTIFEHQNRTFEIYGMTENGHVILREFFDNEHFYWECTLSFVQMKLNRYNHEFINDGVTKYRPMPYETHKLYLPPQKASRKKQEEEESTELETVQFVEDEYKEESEN